MNAPECSICCEELNDSERRPRCLPCGHTICTLCIDKTIKKGDRTCPSCRKPHHVTAADNLPINYFAEEMFQKLSLKSCDAKNKKSDDVRKKKENTIAKTRDSIYSFETVILDWQNEMTMKESLIDNNEEQLAQKLAEVECLKK
ncbi:unnamed protein product, partial [Meganyctiphanes norvegica]